MQPNVAKAKGTWVTDCTHQTSGSGKVTIVFGLDDQNRVSSTVVNYSDTDCASVALTQTLIWNVKDDGTGTATSFDLQATLVAADGTLSSADYVTQANQTQLCGKTDWTLNTKKSLLGLTCDGNVVKSKETDRISVSSNPNGTLSVEGPSEQSYTEFHR